MATLLNGIVVYLRTVNCSTNTCSVLLSCMSTCSKLVWHVLQMCL